MSGEVLIIKDDLYQFDNKKNQKIPSDMLVMKDDLYVFDECNKEIDDDVVNEPKKYLIECPFESINDNEVSLDACRGCYWNNGVINNLEGVPVKVKCVHGFHNNYIVQVFSDYHGE